MDNDDIALRFHDLLDEFAQKVISEKSLIISSMLLEEHICQLFNKSEVDIIKYTIGATDDDFAVKLKTVLLTFVLEHQGEAPKP